MLLTIVRSFSHSIQSPIDPLRFLLRYQFPIPRKPHHFVRQSVRFMYMKTDGDSIEEDNSRSIQQFDAETLLQTSNFFLDQVGEVAVTLNSDGLSWKLIEPLNKDGSTCLGVKLASKSETAIRFSDVYASDVISYGLVHESALGNAGSCLGRSFEIYRFTVHWIQRSKTQSCLWVPSVYTFGHKDPNTCHIWVNQINACIEMMEADRPKNLLVFVHPRSGKGNGFRTWESVAPIFKHAKVKTKVTVTQRRGHAFDVMASITDKELSSYDGVVSVGGDGFFNEVLNGLLLSRHKVPHPPTPPDFGQTSVDNSKVLVHETSATAAEPSNEHNDDQSPLLLGSSPNRSPLTNFRTLDDACETDGDPKFSFPNEQFRFGIIPSGSTDAIVICTTGARDPVTSALQIVLGKRASLDIARIVRWKETSTSKDELCVRYAASFAGYGFYGDVIKESEKYRWMGPKRYDYAGTKVFLRHRSYEAEVAYLEAKSEINTLNANKSTNSGRRRSFWSRNRKPERVICRANCKVCNTESVHESPQDSKWVRSRGRYLSVGAAVMSNRNEKAPDGLVADAHLSDGFLHLILIKDCPHAHYLWHLTQLAKKGGTPLDFEFVEHHKTTAFTFTSSGKESIWNVDGELFKAHRLSAQVFRGLINLFATGPEV